MRAVPLWGCGMRRGQNVSINGGRGLGVSRYAGGGRSVKIDFRVPFFNYPTRTKPPRELFSAPSKRNYLGVFRFKSP